MSLAKSLFAAAISVVQMSAAVPVVVAVVVRMSAAVCMVRSPSRKTIHLRGQHFFVIRISTAEK
jgi:hypothetical protein